MLDDAGEQLKLYAQYHLKAAQKVLEENYPQAKFKHLGSGGFGDVFEDENNPNLVYKICGSDSYAPNFTIELDGDRVRRLDNEITNLDLLGEKGFGPLLHLDKLVRTKNYYIIVMDKITFDEEGVEYIPEEQRKKYAEALYAFFLQQENMFPGDSDVVWDKVNQRFVILDGGSLRKADYSQIKERALLANLIKRALFL